MASVLYLTAQEKKLFDGFSKELQDGWQVQTETLDAYETDDDLRTRVSISEFDSYPEVKSVLRKVQEGESIDTFSLDDVPAEVFDEVMFTVGARGVSSFLRALLHQSKTDVDIQGVAGLSQIRHAILETNQSISYV